MNFFPNSLIILLEGNERKSKTLKCSLCPPPKTHIFSFIKAEGQLPDIAKAVTLSKQFQQSLFS